MISIKIFVMFRFLCISSFCLLVQDPDYDKNIYQRDIRSSFYESSIVCKVKILSQVNEGEIEDPFSWPYKISHKMSARVKLLSKIKGDVPEKFNIEYIKRPGPTYAHLAKDEICIVFLTLKDNIYNFFHLEKGKCPCSKSIINSEYGDQPPDLMLTELIAFCKESKGWRKLKAMELVGQFRDQRSGSYLKEFYKSEDIIVRGISYVASIQTGNSPGDDNLLSYLGHDLSIFDEEDSFVKYKTNAYTVLKIQKKILYAFKNNVQLNNSVYSLEPPLTYDLLKNFDYLAFYEKALQLPSIQQDEWMRCCIVRALRYLADENSLPILKILLDDTCSMVKYGAVATLCRIFKENSLPSVARFKSNEEKYVSYWKDRLD